MSICISVTTFSVIFSVPLAFMHINIHMFYNIKIGFIADLKFTYLSCESCCTVTGEEGDFSFFNCSGQFPSTEKRQQKAPPPQGPPGWAHNSLTPVESRKVPTKSPI